MNRPLAPTRPSGLASRVLALVDNHGSPEERKLVSKHARELAGFLDHPETARFTRHGSLDIGIENRPILKFNLIANDRVSPWPLINDLAESQPALRDLAELVLRHRLRCHVGMKLSPFSEPEYELYTYETQHRLLAKGIFSGYAPDRTNLPTRLYCFGYSSRGDLSAYADLADVEPAELEAAIGFPLPASGLAVSALFHSRWKRETGWRADKAGIEYKPFPSHMLNAVLSHAHLNFAYLLHRGGIRRYGVIGMHGFRQVLYTTLLPQATAQAGAHDKPA